MTARILDGKALAARIQAELADQVIEFIENNSIEPMLAVIQVGENPASDIYVRNKQRACERVGMQSRLHRLPTDVSQDELLRVLARLNKDDDVHGILVQLPLPPQIDSARVLHSVAPHKDVDAFHPENVGRLVQGKPRFLPCTPYGIQQLLIREGIEIAGRHVVIVGRSDIVGKPLANMFVQHGAGGEATVTVCHSRTPDISYFTRQADILVAAVGRPRLITADMIKPGATVIDVGINRTDAGITGDVDFAGACEVAGAITPVPGGVGPLTIAMLLANTLTAAREAVR